MTASPRPLRVVFDTTIYVGGVYFAGTMRKALMSTLRDNVELFTSYRIMSEFYWTCAADKRFASEARKQDPKSLWTLLRATVVTPADIPPTSADPNDDHVLGAAVAAKADMIVSSDHHLLALKSFRGIPIVTAPEYLRQLAARQRSVA